MIYTVRQDSHFDLFEYDTYLNSVCLYVLAKPHSCVWFDRATVHSIRSESASRMALQRLRFMTTS